MHHTMTRIAVASLVVMLTSMLACTVQQVPFQAGTDALAAGQTLDSTALQDTHVVADGGNPTAVEAGSAASADAGSADGDGGGDEVGAGLDTGSSLLDSSVVGDISTGPGDVQTVPLDAGTSVDSATVSDSGPADAGSPPIYKLAIITPFEKSAHEAPAKLSLSALVLDNQHPPSESTVQWSSDIDGKLGASKVNAATGSADLSAVKLSPGEHTLTASASHLSGSKASETVLIAVCKATIVIVAPKAGAVLATSDTIKLQAKVSG